jgi:predicted phosphodiesterase
LSFVGGWDDEPMRIVVLSDTHAPRFWKRCPLAVAEHLGTADVILHAGDVCVASVLEELSAYAPGMIHDAGPKEGRLARLSRRFPKADLVVFGHSHIPLQAVEGNFRIFNPGSPTDKRRQPHRTLGLLEIDSGHLARADIVILP